MLVDSMYAGNIDLTQPLIWTVENVLSLDECRRMIARIEDARPETAPINTGGVQREVRNNGRVILDDPDLAQLLFERVREHVPTTLHCMTIAGANERLRCYRYRPGEYFALHHDGSFQRSPTERSLLTFMVYLNGDFEGGETDFPELARTIVPDAGRAVLFQHMVLHEGAQVRSGTKYAVRSEIMYRQA